MGCASTRYATEEITLASHSLRTGFEKQTVASVCSAIRRHSIAGFILASQFEAIKRDLHLNTQEKDQATLAAFYKQFEAVDVSEATAKIQAVSIRLTTEQIQKPAILVEEQLLVTAILLSIGTAKQKADALFRVFDAGSTNSISLQTLTDLLALLFRAAVDYLPTLFVKKDADDVHKYLTKAREFYSKAVTSAVALLKQKDAPAVSLDHFTSQMSELHDGELASIRGLRKFMIDQAPKPTIVTESTHKTDAKKTEAVVPPAEEARQA